MGSYGRSMAIIGFFGLLNLCASLLLLRRNHIVAWLTLLPPLALSLPLVAIPLSTLILRHNPTDGLITFSRPLLGIPAALALVTLCTRWWPALSAARAGRAETRFNAFFSPSSFLRSNRPFVLFSFSLFALMVVPNTGMSYNRLFNFLMVPPDDLVLQHVVASNVAAELAQSAQLPHSRAQFPQELAAHGGVLASPGVSYALDATGATLIARAQKQPTSSVPSASVSDARNDLQHIELSSIQSVPFWPLANLYTPRSTEGYLSGHWWPDVVTVEHAGQAELFAPSTHPPASRRLPNLWVE
ncbi:MAG: hypothetical protein ABUL61_04680, partial [Oleiharenicola lentus]